MIALILGGVALTSPAQAALVNCGQYDSSGKINECTIGDLILTVVNIINFLLAWSWLVALLFIFWAGWGMVNSGGNEEAIAEAKTTLSNAIIGFALVMMAFLLINAIVSILTGNDLGYADSLKDAFGIIKP